VAARPVSVKAKRCPRWIQPAGSRVVAELARIQVVIEAVSLQQTRVAPMLHDLSDAQSDPSGSVRTN
jgi:hypothetical protein